MSREEIKDQHERCVVDQFIHFWDEHHRERFYVVERPDPPEAIVESSQRQTWIEVATVYVSDEWARDLHSYANPDEKHVLMAPGPYASMDATFAKRFLRVLSDKLSKKSYRAVARMLGPGILLLDIKSPWFESDTCKMMAQECRKADWTKCTGYFSHIFIAYPHLNQTAFREWKECPSIINFGQETE